MGCEQKRIGQPVAAANAGRARRLQSHALGPAWLRSTFANMKRGLTIIGAALLGAAVSSLLWGWCLAKLQSEMAALNTAQHHGGAIMGEAVLTYLDNPRPEQRDRIAFAASNSISAFSVSLKAWDDRYPWLHVGRQFETERRRLEQFLRDRRAGGGEPGGAASRSQPVRQETNPESAAAGSGR